MAISKFLNPKNDIAFKKIFGSEKHKDILIHFINDILGREGETMITSVEFLPTVQSPDIAYRKQSIVDVLCREAGGAQIIVEMQVSPEKGFEKRAQYYAAKAYSSQLNKGSSEDGKYANLKEVIFIAISDYIVFPQKTEYISHHIILDRETYEHDLRDFSFSFVELPKFKITDIAKLTNITQKWCYFFKHAAETSEAAMLEVAGSDSVIAEAYEVLNQFNWSEAELNDYERELKRIWDNKAAEEYIIDKALAEGEAKGMEKGIEKGIELIARNLLKQGSTINFVQQVTQLHIDVIKRLQNDDN